MRNIAAGRKQVCVTFAGTAIRIWDKYLEHVMPCGTMRGQNCVRGIASILFIEELGEIPAQILSRRILLLSL